jgi:oligopeptide transport system substrate-binding protein
MLMFRSSRNRLGVALITLALIIAGCTANANTGMYFGKVEPPADDVLRYITGDEPESLDPQVSTGQPEGRIYMALYEGLTEYDPKTTEAIPGVAESWHANSDASEIVFHLRKNARFSNGDPITAQDFLYTFRRGFSPELAARNAYLGYYIKYAQAYNEGDAFVKDPKTGEFLLEKDFSEETEAASPATPASATPTEASPAKKDAETPTNDKSAKDSNTEANEYPPTADEKQLNETPFHQFMHSPTRLIVPGDEKARTKAAAANPKLKDALVGKEFVPVTAEDIGVEAVDDYTLRVSLAQSAPFFIGLIPNQFFRVVPRKVIEKYGEAWTQPANIVTSGPFKVQTWKPYDKLLVVRDPMYWDAEHVGLNGIAFFPSDDNPTAMNLYKAGGVDAVLNHTVPAAWLDMVRQYKDYMDAPENAIDYYLINVTKPPMNDVRVRKAFNMTVNKDSYAKWRRIVKPLTAFTPEGIFPGYVQPKGDGFNPEKAKQLLVEAGYKDSAGKYDPSKFPANQVELSYNTQESNKAVAEFIQAQWKQNLGITVSIKNQEWKTFLNGRSKLEYKGFARGGWVGDYMDPLTYLTLFSTPGGDNGTGWYDPKFVKMLNDANKTLDKAKRFEMLAKAEAYMLDAQPVISLATAATNWVKKPYVKGLYPNPTTMHAWKFVYIEHDPAKWDQGVPSMKD